MKPISLLMEEHRIIEKVIALFKKELDIIAKTKKIHPSFIETSIDFMKTYADKCHHGKEEGILFRELAGKNIASVHRKVVSELIIEHDFARKKIKELADAKERYDNGQRSAVKDIVDTLSTIVKFYPGHIAKEDRQFFIPFLNYFTLDEQANMLGEFFEFDRTLIHEKYNQLIKDMSKQLKIKDNLM